MRRVKGIISWLAVAGLLLLSIPAPSFAAGAFSYEAEAQVLKDLGLYKGLSETEFVPDLGTALNRETGVVMLLRIFGLEDDAQAITDADATLAKFTDAASVSSWAKNAVAYAVKNGLVSGYPDGTFGPKAALNGKAYCTLILRQLGYTPDYNNAPAELADKGGLTTLQAVKFTEKSLIKDDLVGISYGALNCQYSDGKTVIERLVTTGQVTVSPVSKPTVNGTVRAVDAAISGTAEANSVISVKRSGIEIGGATTNSTGAYTVSMNPGVVLAVNDSLSITATRSGQPITSEALVLTVAEPESFAPKNLTAEAGNGVVFLRWDPVEGADSYNVKRSTRAGGPFETIKTGLKSTSYTDTGLQNDTTYYYVVTAVKKVPVSGEAG